MKISFTATGDALLQTRLPKDYKGFSGVRDYISKGDVRFTNLETVLSEFNCFGSSYCGGQWICAEPKCLDDIREYGLNVFGCANNHSMDYSYDGLYSTIDTLKAADVPYAGIGMNLYEASRPAFIDTKNGRVAFISICSSFNDAARAGEQSDKLPGRPGLNPLRWSAVYDVTEEQMKTLKEIAGSTYMNSIYENNVQRGFRLPPPEGCFSFGEILFRTADKAARRTYCNKNDLERTVRTVKDALKDADYCVIMVHSHQIKADSYTQPDYFFEEFSHAVIDAGAAAVIGGGTHQIKGVELYKGSPVFYSLGNFIFQSESAPVQPADFIEMYKLSSKELTKTEAYEERGRGKVSLHKDNLNFRSLLPYMEFEDGKLTKLLLRPIDLGFEERHTMQGLPMLADAKVSGEIFEYLKSASSEYGTKYKQHADGTIEVIL